MSMRCSLVQKLVHFLRSSEWKLNSTYVSKREPFVSATNVTATGFIIENCTSSSGNGTILVKSKSKAKFENIRIRNNKNRALFVDLASHVIVENSFFNNNEVDSLEGGAIHGLSWMSLEVSNSIFSSKNPTMMNRVTRWLCLID